MIQVSGAQVLPYPNHTLTLLLIGAYFVLLLVGMVRRGREISGPWLFLLRSFFPNWRFYHDIGYQPRLYWRHADDDAPWSDWTLFMPRAAFRVRDLFHNADNNLALARQNLVDHLSADVQGLPDDGDARTLVTYRLVDRLVREQLQSRSLSVARYQFQVRLLPATQASDDIVNLLTSPELPWS